MEGITAEKVQKLSKAYAELATVRARLTRITAMKRVEDFRSNIYAPHCVVEIKIPYITVLSLMEREVRDKEDIIKALGGVI